MSSKAIELLEKIKNYLVTGSDKEAWDIADIDQALALLKEPCKTCGGSGADPQEPVRICGDCGGQGIEVPDCKPEEAVIYTKNIRKTLSSIDVNNSDLPTRTLHKLLTDACLAYDRLTVELKKLKEKQDAE